MTRPALTRTVLSTCAVTVAAALLAAPRAEAHVTIEVENDTITRVEINGRPGQWAPFKVVEDGQKKRREGAHTTAYHVLEAMTQTRLYGRTLVEALDELDAIYAHIRSLPGWKLCKATDAPDDQLNVGTGTASYSVVRWRERCVKNADAARVAIDEARASSSKTRLSTLQTAIDALLTYRNSIGLTVVYVHDDNKTEGEDQAVETLWNAESSDEDGIEEAADALLGSAVAAAEQLPLGAPAGKSTRKLISEQHDATLRFAFPNAFRDANVKKLPYAGISWEDANPAAATFSAQVTLATDGSIDDMNLRGRPVHAKFKSVKGGMGAHTTAYALIKGVVRYAIQGESIKSASRRVRLMQYRLTKLPGLAPVVGDERDALLSVYKRMSWESRTELWGRALTMHGPLTDFWQKLASQMYETKEDLRTFGSSEERTPPTLVTLQAQIGHWIALRNAMPFAVIDRPSKALHEGKIPGLLRAYRSAGAPQRQKLLGELVDVSLDRVAVGTVCDSGKTEVTKYPGVILTDGKFKGDYVVKYLVQHVLTIAEVDKDAMRTWLDSDAFAKYVAKVVGGASSPSCEAEQIVDDVRTIAAVAFQEWDDLTDVNYVASVLSSGVPAKATTTASWVADQQFFDDELDAKVAQLDKIKPNSSQCTEAVQDAREAIEAARYLVDVELDGEDASFPAIKGWVTFEGREIWIDAGGVSVSVGKGRPVKLSTKHKVDVADGKATLTFRLRARGADDMRSDPDRAQDVLADVRKRVRDADGCSRKKPKTVDIKAKDNQ